MIQPHDTHSLTTVSRLFIDDWLTALRRVCTAQQMQVFLERAGLDAAGTTRVTLDQIVTLYQIAAVDSGDEMMGLWSRPIRARALQHLLTTVATAQTLPAVLHRFSTFWNLLLDDISFKLDITPERITLSIVPLYDQTPQRFGHLLILKLAHGLLSWRAGYEVPVAGVHFAFARPEFAADYQVIFPSPVTFDAPRSAILFDPAKFGPAQVHSKSELTDFVKRAPRDWMFTGYREHTQSLRVRAFLSRSNWQDCRLIDAAETFRMTPRTLMRRLDGEGTSFQSIKDGLRRDIAIRDLRAGGKSIEQISQELGFSSAANFHRAFRRWTGQTPVAFRQVAG